MRLNSCGLVQFFLGVNRLEVDVDVRDCRLEEICELDLREPDRLVFEAALNAGAAVFGLVEDQGGVAQSSVLVCGRRAEDARESTPSSRLGARQDRSASYAAGGIVDGSSTSAAVSTQEVRSIVAHSNAKAGDANPTSHADKG